MGASLSLSPSHTEKGEYGNNRQEEEEAKSIEKQTMLSTFPFSFDCMSFFLLSQFSVRRSNKFTGTNSLHTWLDLERRERKEWRNRRNDHDDGVTGWQWDGIAFPYKKGTKKWRKLLHLVSSFFLSDKKKRWEETERTKIIIIISDFLRFRACELLSTCCCSLCFHLHFFHLSLPFLKKEFSETLEFALPSFLGVVVYTDVFWSFLLCPSKWLHFSLISLSLVVGETRTGWETKKWKYV